MSRHVYVSFLGTGMYTPVVYSWNGKASQRTPYGQEAELELMGSLPDRVYIFGTKESHKMHWEGGDKDGGARSLRERIEAMGLSPEFVLIPTDQSGDNQWQTFQKMLELVGPGDALTLDMTHGFRAVPVVFSSALHFLRLTRNIELRHVLYCLYERDVHTKDPDAHHLIQDYASFYAIQDWTEGVSRLVEDADATHLARLSGDQSSLPIAGFSDQEITAALSRLTDAVRNVEVHNVEPCAREALGLVNAAQQRAAAQGHTAARILLELIEEKFSSILTAEPLTGLYDANYFKVQLLLASLLLEHNLVMQAFTVMQEMIGSFGLYGYPNPVRYDNRKGRDKRSYADVFLPMANRERSTWHFSGHKENQMRKLLPFYERLEEAGITTPLQELGKELGALRNGLNHAWTNKVSAPTDILSQGHRLHARLSALTQEILSLEESGS